MKVLQGRGQGFEWRVQVLFCKQFKIAYKKVYFVKATLVLVIFAASGACCWATLRSNSLHKIRIHTIRTALLPSRPCLLGNEDQVGAVGLRERDREPRAHQRRA